MRSVDLRLGSESHAIELDHRKHRERLKNIRPLVDTSLPECHKGHPNKRAQESYEDRHRIRRDNNNLAQKLFGIMDKPSSMKISQNRDCNADIHPGTLNFKVRLDEADRINQMNLRLATRLETVKPNYTKKEYKTVVAIKPKIKLNLKYSPLPQLSNYHARDYNYHSPMVNDAANGFYCRTDESASRTVEVQHIVTPELRKHNKNSAKSMTIKPKILLEFTTVQYGRAIDTVVIKEPFKDRYAVFGIDVLSGQRYELHFTSEEIFNVLESDMLVTSVEDERVWHALLHKVDFEPIEQFTKIKSRNSASPLAHQRKIERNPQYNEINGENFSVMEGSVTDYFDFYQETTDFQLSNQNDNNERYESQIENSTNHEENYNVRQNENDTKYEDNFDVRGMMDPRSDQSGITDPRSRHVVQHLQQLREEESSVISTLDDEYYPDFDSDTFEVVNENVNYNTRDEMKYTRDGLNRQDDNFNSEDEEDFVEDYRNRQIIDKGRVERASPAPVSVAHRTKISSDTKTMDHIREQTYRESEQDAQQSVSIHAHAHVHGNGRRQRRRTGSLPHYMKPRAVSLIADGIINPTLKPQPPSPGSMTPGTGVRPTMGRIKQGEAMARLAAPPKRPDPPETTPFKGRKKSFIAPSSAHTTTTTTTTVNADAIAIVTASTAAMNSTDRSATSTATDVTDGDDCNDDKDLFDTISEPEPSVSSSLPVDNFNENLDYVQVVSPTELSRDRGSSPTKIKDIHIIPKGDEIKFTPVQPKEPLRSIRPRVQSQALSVRRTSILRKAGTDVVKSESPTKLNNQSGPRRRVSKQGVAVPVVTPPVYKVEGKDKLENGCEKTCGVVDNIQVDFDLSKDEPVQLSTSNNAEHFNLSNHGNNGSEKSSSQQLESCVHLEKSETNDLIMDEEAQYLHDNFDGDVDINVDVDVVADDAMCIQFIEGDPPPYSEIEENENEIEIEIDENDFTILDTTDDRNSHQKSNSDMSIEIDEMGYGEVKGEEVREEAVIEEEEEEGAEEVRRESNINPKSTKPQIKINIKNRKSSTFGKVDVNRKTSVEGSEKSSFHAIMPISV